MGRRGRAAHKLSELSHFHVRELASPLLFIKIDDPVGAIAAHGVNGAWGVLAVGLFSDGTYGDGWNGVPGTVRGLFYGDASQFVAQVVGITACFTWVFTMFFVFFKVVDAIIGNRGSAEVEMEGLDMPEMGAIGYPDFVMTPGPDGHTASR